MSEEAWFPLAELLIYENVRRSYLLKFFAAEFCSSPKFRRLKQVSAVFVIVYEVSTPVAEKNEPWRTSITDYLAYSCR